ncbi:MAG TPA: HAD family hydrolase [Candidatus Omnitrophota bacterium]|nr:HAD family hydrolase [Candidatus Omnitrophota bacterium]HPD84409.1 HAD family hydrolase [Candidatus Omnitrophota bacterium]HRZ03267.1 HAD family hydrolase [Candidatus Omnitrophota bacterium]
MIGKIDLVIFDLDGTLVDAYGAIAGSFNFAMRRLGFPRQDNAVIRRAVGWGDRNLLRPFVGEKNAVKALRLYRRHHAIALKKKTRFLPGAKRLLITLNKNGYQLAVASNRPTRFSNIILNHLKIRQYFDYVLCGDKLKKPKPNADILLKILKKLSVKKGRAVYVGDMTVDILTGKRAGVKTIAILGGSSSKKEIGALKPYRVIKNISQVWDIVR